MKRFIAREIIIIAFCFLLLVLIFFLPKPLRENGAVDAFLSLTYPISVIGRVLFWAFRKI